MLRDMEHGGGISLWDGYWEIRNGTGAGTGFWAGGFRLPDFSRACNKAFICFGVKITGSMDSLS